MRVPTFVDVNSASIPLMLIAMRYEIDLLKQLRESDQVLVIGICFDTDVAQRVYCHICRLLYLSLLS